MVNNDENNEELKMVVYCPHCEDSFVYGEQLTKHHATYGQDIAHRGTCYVGTLKWISNDAPSTA